MHNIERLLDGFSDKKVLVLGDMIADEFIIGQPERLSREAPVIILEHQDNKILPGGGTNAANNVASLGGQVYLTGVIGDDKVGKDLINVLNDKGIITDGLIIDKQRPTSVKTRILAGGGQTVKQQIVRVDKVKKDDISTKIEDEIISYVKSIMDKMDAVILSDYGNGVFTPRIKRETIKLANTFNKVVAVDSRYELKEFKEITIATPNKEEAEVAVGFKLGSKEDVERAGWKLKEELKAKAVLITLGGEGMQIFSDKGSEHIPASNYTEVFDVTGAGDTVIGSLTLALGSGMDWIESMELSNYAAGIVVRKSGVATVSKEELLEVMKG
ncbi:bifunctional heptose 7-phosphate kinase/heptose 1-phosphate adenyltransferase [Halonatronum saccharophilum]|uniref:bifunctional heptose 7-phosphate kinase/heptose 1-phosphate adenyltransferase n=1 Tax=Halonatronum saccharophilum TaxID=150060 RepID=UPI000484E62E|nr:PfkB family carbohydrate kinase [Halonatronum saccharophilum]